MYHCSLPFETSESLIMLFLKKLSNLWTLELFLESNLVVPESTRKGVCGAVGIITNYRETSGKHSHCGKNSDNALFCLSYGSHLNCGATDCLTLMLIYVFWENIILSRFLEVRAGSCSTFSPNLCRTLNWLMDAKLNRRHNKAFSNQSQVISLFVVR